MQSLNRIKYSRNPNLQGVEACDVRMSLHTFPNHTHDDVYAFSLMEEGGSYWTGKSVEGSFVSPGEIAVINPGQIHSGLPNRENPSTYKMIYIKTALVSDDGFLPEFEKVVVRNPELSDLYERLYRSLLLSSSILEIESNLSCFLGSFISGYACFTPKLPSAGCENLAVKKAVEMLSEDLSRKMTLEEIARYAGFSRYHFLRTFKRATGVSPHIFRTQKRIDAARKLIISGMPLSEVALETGFTDQSHLTNQFRHYTGATPMQYFSC